MTRKLHYLSKSLNQKTPDNKKANIEKLYFISL